MTRSRARRFLLLALVVCLGIVVLLGIVILALTRPGMTQEELNSTRLELEAETHRRLRELSIRVPAAASMLLPAGGVDFPALIALGPEDEIPPELELTEHHAALAAQRFREFDEVDPSADGATPGSGSRGSLTNALLAHVRSVEIRGGAAEALKSAADATRLSRLVTVVDLWEVPGTTGVIQTWADEVVRLARNPGVDADTLSTLRKHLPLREPTIADLDAAARRLTSRQLDEWFTWEQRYRAGFSGDVPLLGPRLMRKQASVAVGLLEEFLALPHGSWIELLDAVSNPSSGWREFFQVGPGFAIIADHTRFMFTAAVHARGVRVVLAIEEHQRRTGQYPASLSDLGSELPLDPASGEPFGYRREGSGYWLYSAGSDGRDDGGDFAADLVIVQPEEETP